MNPQQLRSFHLDQHMLWRDRQQNLIIWLHLSLTSSTEPSAPGIPSQENSSCSSRHQQKLHISSQQGIVPCNANLGEKWVSYKKPRVDVQFLLSHPGAAEKTPQEPQGDEGLDPDCRICSTHPIRQMLPKVLGRNEVRKEWTIPCHQKPGAIKGHVSH